MAFTLETGTGVTDANSYGSIAGADAYHADRGNALWTGDDAVKQAALIRATDHIERAYRDRFIGTRSTSTQGLSWPRDNAYDDKGEALTLVPEAVAYATYEFALSALSSDLDPDPTYETTGRAVLMQRDKADVLETETRFVGGGMLTRRINRKAEGWLASVLSASANVLLRA